MPQSFFHLLALAGLLASQPLGAVTIYALGTDNHLYSFDSADTNAVTDIGLISQPGIVDIDFHAANGVLYGITSTGTAYGISIADASAALRITPGTSVSGVQDFDFNPAADRIRISAAGGVNLRMVPDFITPPSAAGSAGAIVNDGTYSGAPSGVTILANAYTNAFDTPSSSGAPHATTLYSIGSDGVLYSHSTGAGPMGSFGVMTAVGSGLGFSLLGNVGFDITPGNQAYVSNGNNLYTVDLSTGIFTDLPGVINAPIASIAVPEPATIAFSGLAGIALLRRRREV